jgi:hypothetical protein
MAGEVSEACTWLFCRGSGDSTHRRKTDATREAPSNGGNTNWRLVRAGPGSVGWRMGS